MSRFITNLFPATLNGDNVIAYTDAKTAKAEFVNQNLGTLQSWYREDPEKNHLGLIELFANAVRVPNPTVMNLIQPDKNAIIEVNGPRGTFTYDVPISENLECVTLVDTSMRYDKPGIHETTFELILNREFTNGDVLTYNKLIGCQVYVVSDIPVRMDGDTFIHTVKLIEMNGAKFFPKEKLRAGIRYFKVGFGAGEYTKKFSKIEGWSRAGTARCEFMLGGTRGVEGEATYFAGSKAFGRTDDRSSTIIENAMRRIHSLGEVNGKVPSIVAIGSQLKNGNFRPRLIAGLLEFFCLAELMQMEANQLNFQRAGIINDENGPVHFSEGFYHQMKRGVVDRYARPMGLTVEHIRNAFSYLFRNSTLPDYERVAEFEVGAKMAENLKMLFRTEFTTQMTNIRPLMGHDALIKNPISGPNTALRMSPVIFAEVPIEGAGIMRYRHNPALDYVGGIDRGDLIDGQYPITAFTAMIRDITDTNSTNAYAGLPTGNVRVMNPMNNMFYVKPEGQSLFWGYQRGRWDHMSAGEILGASHNLMGEGFFCYNTSAGWIKDLSRCYMIELNES